MSPPIPGEQEKGDSAVKNGGREGLGVAGLRLQPGGGLKLSPREWGGGWGQDHTPAQLLPQGEGEDLSPEAFRCLQAPEGWPGVHSLGSPAALWLPSQPPARFGDPPITKGRKKPECFPHAGFPKLTPHTSLHWNRCRDPQKQPTVQDFHKEGHPPGPGLRTEGLLVRSTKRKGRRGDYGSPKTVCLGSRRLGCISPRTWSSGWS